MTTLDQFAVLVDLNFRLFPHVQNCRSNYSGKDAASNGNKNGNSPAKTTNLRDLPPSQIMGEDGKMEKIHKCPECSKMFTSNINLRRHYKLKHERNQVSVLLLFVVLLPILFQVYLNDGARLYKTMSFMSLPIITSAYVTYSKGM